MKVDGTNISIIRGDTESLSINCKDTSGNKLPFVEGDTIYFTVKISIHEITKIFQKVITQFTDGTAFVIIEPADTKLQDPGTYVYDIQLNKVDGSVKTIIPPSKFHIEGEVTYE